MSTPFREDQSEVTALKLTLRSSFAGGRGVPPIALVSLLG
jgi:hypothetical protein